MSCSHETRGEALTNIFGVELVNANQHTDGRGPENPSKSRAELGELAWMNVVLQEIVKLIPSNDSRKTDETAYSIGFNGGEVEDISQRIP